MEHQSNAQSTDDISVNLNENAPVATMSAQLDLPMAYSMLGHSIEEQMAYLEKIIDSSGQLTTGVNSDEVAQARQLHDVDMVLRPLDVQLALKYRMVTSELHQHLINIGADQDEAAGELASTITRWALHVAFGKPEQFNGMFGLDDLTAISDELGAFLKASPLASLYAGSCRASEQSSLPADVIDESKEDDDQIVSGSDELVHQMDVSQPATIKKSEIPVLGTLQQVSETVAEQAPAADNSSDDVVTIDVEEGDVIASDVKEIETTEKPQKELSDEYQAVLKTLALKESELSNLKNKNGSLLEQIEGQNRTIEQFEIAQADYGSTVRENELLKDKLEELESRSESQKKWLLEKANAVNELESTVRENTLLKDKLEELESKRASQKKWLLEKANAVNELESAVNALKDDLGQSQKDLDDAVELHKQEQERFGLELSEKDKELDLKNEEFCELYQNHQDILNRLEKEKQIADEYQEKNRLLESEAKVHAKNQNEVLGQIEKELDSCSQLILEKKEFIAKQEDYIAQQESYIREIEIELKNTEMQLAEQRYKSDGQLENKEKEILKLCASLQASEEQITILRKVIKSKRKVQSEV